MTISRPRNSSNCSASRVRAGMLLRRCSPPCANHPTSRGAEVRANRLDPAHHRRARAAEPRSIFPERTSTSGSGPRSARPRTCRPGAAQALRHPGGGIEAHAFTYRDFDKAATQYGKVAASRTSRPRQARPRQPRSRQQPPARRWRHLAGIRHRVLGRRWPDMVGRCKPVSAST